jgi:sterol desaturase/sphingolipid hydroxylase (fatty acid hydroxylase superfamily)
VLTFAIFAVIAAVFSAAERFVPLHPQPFFRRGFATDVAYIAIHYVLRLAINGTLAVALVQIGTRTLPAWSAGMLRERPTWLQAIVVIVVLDFFFYVMHRLKHRWTWWWRLHETHHSSLELDWLATARFHPLEKILDRLVFLLPLTVIGPSSGALVIWAAVDAFFGIFIHSNVNWRLGPLVYVFVGPEMHRWHHAHDRDRRECNYGNNLSVFDWLFGTAYITHEWPLRYGVDDPNYPAHNLFRQFVYAFRAAADLDKRQ